MARPWAPGAPFAEIPQNVSGLCWNALEMESTSPLAPAASPAPAAFPAHTAHPYRLVRRPAAAAARLSLDAAQQQVVHHSGGPLLVLAGPGTGKTATIVETVAHRIEDRGLDPARVLVLTFSRKAAGELRERIAGRLHRTIREPLALTFHSYAYALVRREFALLGEEPPRLLSGPEQLLEVRRLLRGELTDGAVNWPGALRPALATRGFAEELRDFLLRAAERGLDGRRVLPRPLRGPLRPRPGRRVRLRRDRPDRGRPAQPGRDPPA